MLNSPSKPDHYHSFGKINSISSLNSKKSAVIPVSVPGAGISLLDGKGSTTYPEMNDLVILKEASIVNTIMSDT